MTAWAALGIVSAFSALSGALGSQNGTARAEAAAGPDPSGSDEACAAGAPKLECEGKAACLQLRLQREAAHAEDLSAALDDLLEIDKLAEKKHKPIEGAEVGAKRRQSLEAELKQLEQRVHDHDVNGTVDTGAIIKHLKGDIRALAARQERALDKEVRKIGEAARSSARDLQAAVRHTARKARGLADKLQRAGHSRRHCSDAADTLSRRVEAAMDRVERKGEVLARRIDRSIQERERHEEADFGHEPLGNLRSSDPATKGAAATAAAAPRAFLERPSGQVAPLQGASFATMAICAGGGAAALAGLLATRVWRRAQVSTPEGALG
mmetsp:Transcript_150493/g.464364  ORF Transcript_150493/g.464364 Transcript_150493/m.464364 type:complete len:324 (-) Transcript_150493:36-1007(-)